MIRAGGGFEAEADEPIMIAQVQLDGVPDAAAAKAAIEQAQPELTMIADQAVPRLVARGGGTRGLEVRDLGDGMVVVHFLVDCRNAMGANLVNTIAERVAPRVAELTGGVIGLRILSNLADRRLTRARAVWPAAELGGEAVVDAILSAWAFAAADPYRAATHNKGIMNGVSAVGLATGNDTGSGDYERFFALSGEVHPRLGLGDLVDASNIVAYNLGYTGSKDNHSWGADVFKFDLEEDVSDEDDLGWELDLWYNYQYSKNLVAQFALGYFNAGDFIDESNRCAYGCDPDRDAVPDGGGNSSAIETSDAWRIYANILLRF